MIYYSTFLMVNNFFAYKAYYMKLTGKNIAIISTIYYSGQVSEKFRRPLSFSNISTWYLIQGYIELGGTFR